MPDETGRKGKLERPAGYPIGTRPSRTVFFLLLLIPILSTVAYGGTAMWALMLIAPMITMLGTIWLVRSWRMSEFLVSSDPIWYPIAGLLLFALFQLLPIGGTNLSGELLSISASNSLSLDPYSTRIFIVRLLGYMIFFLAALTFIDTEKRLRKLAAATAIFGGIAAFAGIIQWLASPDAIYGVRPTPQAIPFGPYVNRHHFASLMVLFSGIALSQVLGRSASKEKKLLFAISLVLMAISTVLTGSRGGVLAYIAMFAVCSLTAIRKANSGTATVYRFPIVAGSAAFVVFIVGLVVFLGGADPLLRGLGLQNETNDITSGRLHFWSVAWQVFTANPIFGAGMEAFGVAYTKFDTRNGFFRTEQAHNDYLQMLADGGVVGFGIAVSFLVMFVKRGINAITNASSEFVLDTRIGAFAGCLGILIHSFFDFPLRTASNAFFFLLVLAMMLVQVSNKQDDETLTGREP